MTIEQKASLCSGKNFWYLKGIESLGIPSIMVTDGPHGLRKQAGDSDHVGLADSVPATCFPTAAALASSWDEKLLFEVGEALGEECLQEKVAVLLGPGANIKRSPLCGRNFEYFSEDPFQSGKMAAAHIRGVQSKGIGTSLKHFAANNQERRRMTIDTIVDERALREVYLAGFEEAVKNGKPDTVMCAYNRLNGEFCSENDFLLRKLLKEEWEHEGFVVTDWGAANNRVKGLAAGLELEMPANGGRTDQEIVDAVREGRLDESVLDEAVDRILKVVFKTAKVIEQDYSYNPEAHHSLAKRALAESAVLLKNEDLLPLNPKRTIAVIGAFAHTPRYQGSGSSLIKPTRVDSALAAIGEMVGEENVIFAEGYPLDSEEPDRLLIRQAAAAAAEADAAVIFAGLPDISESEGFDRDHMDMPAAHNELIKAVSGVSSSVAVVLSNGAPVSMPWLEEVGAVLETYLGGQAWGSAAADLLFGKTVPCGKLAETIPLNIGDVPSSCNFPGGSQSVKYAESIYVGYRYYNTADKAVLFPFGHGLSYTSFEYSNLIISGNTPENTTVGFTVKNTGKKTGAEIAQLYVSKEDSQVFRPRHELKGFAKALLTPGESRRLELRLDRRSFAFWDCGKSDWNVESGRWRIGVGASSRDIRLEADLDLESHDTLSERAARMKTVLPEYFNPSIELFSDTSKDSAFGRLFNRNLPPSDRPDGSDFDRSSTIEDVKHTFVGKRIHKAVGKGLRKQFSGNEDKKTIIMMEALVGEMPLRNMAMMSGGTLNMKVLDALIEMMNGRFFRGLARLLRR